MSIRFGTSGWRAVIADEFTFENVRSATEAICSYLKGSHSGSSRQTLIIGHDTRFMGEKFMATAAEIARKKGFRVLQCEEAVPTPALSHAIRQERAAGGINFTASHNPPEYQGIKFSTGDGAPALPEVTQRIEAAINGSEQASDSEGGSIESYDARTGYLADLSGKIGRAHV